MAKESQPSAVGSRGLILMYHRIADGSPDPWALCVSPQHFSEHLEVLRKWHLIPLQHLPISSENQLPSDKWVALTFDDGYADNLHHAKPLLERYEIPATVFLATGYIGGEREFWWDELEKVFLLLGTLPPMLRLHIEGKVHEWDLAQWAHYSQDSFLQWQHWRGWNEAPTPRHSLYHEVRNLLQPLSEDTRRPVLNELLTWAQIHEHARPTHRVLSNQEVIVLAQGGLIELGAHTVTHSRLSDIPVSRQYDEIAGSKHRLEELAGHPITSFAYPFGARADYTEDTVGLVRQCGFVRACSTVTGVVHEDTDPFELSRVAVQNWDGEHFARQLRNWLEQ